MATTEEDILHEQEVLHEEERLQEAEGRRAHCMEIMLQIADLECDRDRSVNHLRRFSNQTISKFNFCRMEDTYIALLNLDSALNVRISDWEDLLDLDQTENPAYPGRGQQEHRYSPGAEDFSNKTNTMEGVLSQCQEVLKRFFISLPAADQAIVSLEARTAFLKSPTVWQAGYCNLDQDNDQEDQEDDEETVIGQQGAGQDTPHAEEGVHNEEQETNSNQSPRNSIESSKSVRIRGRSYQTQKQRINKLLSKLESDPDTKITLNSWKSKPHSCLQC